MNQPNDKLEAAITKRWTDLPPYPTEPTPIIDELLESECRSEGHANKSWVREHQARNIERAFHRLERELAQRTEELGRYMMALNAQPSSDGATASSGPHNIFEDEDHQRGCQGRTYTCTCGYDDRVIARGAELERQLSASTLKDEADRFAKTTADSADAQCFRWLLTHHGGSDGKRCWIGGVEFLGQNLRVSIIDAIDREDGAPYVVGDSPK